MNKEDVLKMEAGPKMNQTIWWKIFNMEPTPENNDILNLPDYSNDIADAWEVADKLKLTIAPYDNGAYHAADGKVIAWADTAPLAICRAALMTVMEEEK